MAETPARKVIDIARPGDSPSDPNSKSIIVTNRPIIKDPMMASVETPNADLEKKKDDPSSSEAKAEVNTLPKIEVLGEFKPSDKKPQENPAQESEDEKSEPEIAIKEDSVMQEAQSDDGLGGDQKSKDDAAIAREAEAEAAKEANMQKLVDTKAFFLPINTLEKRRTHKTVTIGIILSVILGLAWLNIALDAGILSLGGLKALTHFF